MKNRVIAPSNVHNEGGLPIICHKFLLLLSGLQQNRLQKQKNSAK